MITKSFLQSLAKCVCLRLKRAVLFSSFLLVISIIVIVIFATLNQNHAQLAFINTHLRGGNGLGPEVYDISLIKKSIEAKRGARPNVHVPQKRPMVQFYPDNQNKMLFRKSNVIDDQPIIDNVPLGISDTFHEDSSLVNSVNNANIAINERDRLPFDKVHIFYYAWYGNPTTDGEWSHWNHEYLPNWDKKDKRPMPSGKHDPEKLDVGANYFPQLGLYSSSNKDLIAQHMKLISQSQVGVIVLSWYPPGLSDPNGHSVDELVPTLLDAANVEGLKLALHVEPYDGRTPSGLRSNLTYVAEKYSHHPAFYKLNKKPVYYIYDSYQSSPQEWARLLKPDGDLTIRGTDLDGTFLGLLVEFKHRADIKSGGFDGFYTYFGSNGFSYGSTWKNWRNLAMFARRNSLIFIPSVAPGYNDLRVRPWNGANKRNRRKGAYYDIAWKTFLELQLQYVSITSYNEWHEGTQIEPAIPKAIKDYTYSSYVPHQPDFYLLKTRSWVQKFKNSTRNA